MLSQEDIIQKLQSIKPELEEKYFVKKIGIFGSYASNNYSENSDIDILVEFKKPIGWIYLSLEIYLEKIFNKKIDLVTKNAIKKQISNNILEEVKFI
ncbi:MAG: nucleotidyltransferase family protein [Bacteroidales bacterium]|nr:nucleotidyltransferase family protein [Bacteroidales bacterium]